MLRNLLDWRSEWRKTVFLVTHKRYFVGLKPAFGRTLWEFFHTRWKILLYKVIFYPHKVTLNKTIKKSKFQFGWREPLVAIFDQLSCCWPFWMLAITRITKMITMALPSMIETCNEKWILLSLDQTCCQSSWMAIARNHENGWSQIGSYWPHVGSIWPDGCYFAWVTSNTTSHWSEILFSLIFI